MTDVNREFAEKMFLQQMLPTILTFTLAFSFCLFLPFPLLFIYAWKQIVPQFVNDPIYFLFLMLLSSQHCLPPSDLPVRPHWLLPCSCCSRYK